MRAQGRLKEFSSGISRDGWCVVDGQDGQSVGHGLTVSMHLLYPCVAGSRSEGQRQGTIDE